MMAEHHDHIHTKEFNDMFYVFGHVSTKFLGHIFCGASMLALGTWWAVNVLLDYHRSRPHATLNPEPRPFRCRAWYAGPWRSGVPLDGVIKIVVGLIEVTGEAQGTYYNRTFHWNDTTQHIVLYSTFVLSGVIDLLTHRRVAALPPGTDFAGLALFYGTGSFLFLHHFHGESALNSRMHSFLLWLAVASLLAVAREMSCGTGVWPSLIRAQLALLFGSWLLQISFTLYNPMAPPGGHATWGWDENSNVALMVAVVYFCSHVQLSALLLLLLSAVVGRRVRSQLVSRRPLLVVGFRGCAEDERSSDDAPLIKAGDRCIVSGY